MTTLRHLIDSALDTDLSPVADRINEAAIVLPLVILGIAAVVAMVVCGWYLWTRTRGRHLDRPAPNADSREDGQDLEQVTVSEPKLGPAPHWASMITMMVLTGASAYLIIFEKWSVYRTFAVVGAAGLLLPMIALAFIMSFLNRDNRGACWNAFLSTVKKDLRDALRWLQIRR